MDAPVEPAALPDNVAVFPVDDPFTTVFDRLDINEFELATAGELYGDDDIIGEELEARDQVDADRILSFDAAVPVDLQNEVDLLTGWMDVTEEDFLQLVAQYVHTDDVGLITGTGDGRVFVWGTDEDYDGYLVRQTLIGPAVNQENYERIQELAAEKEMPAVELVKALIIENRGDLLG